MTKLSCRNLSNIRNTQGLTGAICAINDSQSLPALSSCCSSSVKQDEDNNCQVFCTISTTPEAFAQCMANLPGFDQSQLYGSSCFATPSSSSVSSATMTVSTHTATGTSMATTTASSSTGSNAGAVVRASGGLGAVKVLVILGVFGVAIGVM